MDPEGYVLVSEAHLATQKTYCIKNSVLIWPKYSCGSREMVQSVKHLTHSIRAEFGPPEPI